MHVVRPADAADFLRQAEGLLLADEARHNLIFGVVGTLRDHPGHYREHRLWLMRDGDEVVAAAVMTPPHNIVLAGSGTALAALAGETDEVLPGATGAIPEVEDFARAWSREHGVRIDRRRAQGIYALETLVPPAPVSGSPRAAREDDREVLGSWLRAFGREALGEEEADEDQLARVVESRLTRSDAGFVVWEDGDTVVSLAGFGGPTPSGVRIGPVYTPPEHRGRGYGSAVTAAVTAERLAAGRRFCFLYTDLANPVSNRIYKRLGYRRVCDSLELRFV
jgi:uncharacterized protein